MPPTNLETITGNLRDAYKQIQPGTMQHSDELTTARRTDVDLRSQWFYTADGNVYSLDNGTPTLRITREATNPILKNIEDAFTQLTTKSNYQVPQADFDAVKAAPDTVTIDLTKLNLQSDRKEWSYLAISTTNYDTLNPEELELAKRVYGQGTDFTENMQMLKDANINETRIFVLNPTYVTEHAKDSPVARASWLNNFVDDSCFGVYVRGIDDDFRLRGVRREVVREAVAPNVVNPVDRQMVRDLQPQLPLPPRIGTPTQHAVLGPTRPPIGPDECPLEID